MPIVFQIAVADPCEICVCFSICIRSLNPNFIIGAAATQGHDPGFAGRGHTWKRTNFFNHVALEGSSAINRNFRTGEVKTRDEDSVLLETGVNREKFAEAAGKQESADDKHE
jgi:hypothetical protein